MRMVENWCSDEEKPLVFHVWFPKATTTLKQKVPSVQMALKNWQSNQNKLYWFGGYHPSTKHLERNSFLKKDNQINVVFMVQKDLLGGPHHRTVKQT